MCGMRVSLLARVVCGLIWRIVLLWVPCPFDGPFWFHFGPQLPVELRYGGGFCGRLEFSRFFC